MPTPNYPQQPNERSKGIEAGDLALLVSILVVYMELSVRGLIRSALPGSQDPRFPMQAVCSQKKRWRLLLVARLISG